MRVKSSEKPKYLLLEGQLVDIADDIVYVVHDIEDALYQGFLDFSDLEKNSLTSIVLKSTKKEIGKLKEMSVIARHIRKNFRQELESSVISHSQKLIEDFEILLSVKFSTVVSNNGFFYTPHQVIDFDQDIKEELTKLKSLLYKNYYYEADKKVEETQREYIKKLFFELKNNPDIINEKPFYIEMFRDKDINICIKDYISLLTEGKFKRILNKIFKKTFGHLI